MARGNLYRIDKLELDKLLIKAIGNDEKEKGATLILPDLQRPFRWSPVQVLRLIDSLIRGWPFGTLLLWELKGAAGEELEVPCRSFWQNVSSLSSKKSIPYAMAGQPNSFQLVLDGQQRLQSLLLATGIGMSGYLMHDREWADYLERNRPRARYWSNYWSLAQLSLNIDLFIDQAEQRDVRDIFYTDVLDWVICNGDQDMSKERKPQGYEHPLKYIRNGNSTEFIQFSRLWSIAQRNFRARDYEQSDKLKDLFNLYKIDEKRQASLRLHLPELLEILGDTKQMDVGFLQLVSYDDSPLSSSIVANGRDRYDDAVIQIFTRLNSGGTVLTQQEITFAWIKRKWNSDLTKGVDAYECFEKLLIPLRETGYVRNMDELVQVVSHIWASLNNEGNLLGQNDLLKGSIVAPMAQDICKQWTHFCENLSITSKALEELGIERSVSMVNSLYALTVLWSWSMLYNVWKASRTLDVSKGDDFDKMQQEHFARYADRWLILSSWAGRWQRTAYSNYESYMKTISSYWHKCKSILEHDKAAEMMESIMTQWLNDLQNDSSKYIANLAVDNRDRVREYYLALWVWHRLDNIRWMQSQIPLRTNTRKQPILHVDHLISYDLWTTLYGLESDSESSPEKGAGATSNDIGNMMLLETDFNISKSNSTLSDWISEIHEFKRKKVALSDWIAAMSIPATYLAPKADDETKVKTDVSARTNAIKLDLNGYIEGIKPLYPKGKETQESVSEPAPQDTSG
jgi:Protein of unknown function DUF262